MDPGGPSSTPTVSLKVIEAYTRDVGRNIARIDRETMETIGVRDGFVIEVQGKQRATVALCMALDRTDEAGKGIVRLDGRTRNNAGVAIGFTVTVRRARALPAEKIVLAQLEAVPPIDERYLTTALEGIPVAVNDNVLVPYFGGRLAFKVIEIAPEQGQDTTTMSSTISIALVTARIKFAIGGREKGNIKFHISEYVRQEPEIDVAASPNSLSPDVARNSVSAPLYLGLKLELFLGAISERIDFQKRMEANEKLNKIDNMARFARRYIETTRAEVDEANRKAGENSRLYDAMVQAEKEYPSALIDNEGELRQMLQELKYRIIRKWADASAD